MDKKSASTCALRLESTESELIKELVRDSDNSKRDVVERFYAEHCEKGDPSSVDMQLEIAFYFENIGDAHRAVVIARKAVDKAYNLSDVNLRRRAHNTAGILCSRTYDFEQACFHLERALVIAREMKSELLEFAALCNIVSTLQVMGLLQEAKILALKLSRRGGGTQELDYLHLQNAVNGLRLSEHMTDVEVADYFREVARAKVKSAGPLANTWRACIDSCDALFLVQQGKADEAFNLIFSAIQDWGAPENTRVSVRLYCALGTCAIAVENEEQIHISRSVLTGLLERTKDYAMDREDVLRTLVELYSGGRSAQEKRAELVYLHQLSDHIVNVKHKQFFDRVQRGAESDAEDSLQQISRPSYTLPTIIAAAATDGESLSFARSVPAVVGNQVQEKALRTTVYSRRGLEQLYRSDDFNAAEDWAVAADFASDRKGGHCFEVGTLAGLIASQAGYSPERCVLIEMACRLHDIGKLAVSAAVHRAVNAGTLDDYLSILRHSAIGARLLSLSSDVTLQMASGIAHHHHEWWNGCGLPQGIAGESILLEARICSIADAYLVLLHPSEPQVGWEKDAAVQQVISMAGVQLDPNLMAPFLLAVEVYNAMDANEVDEVKPFNLNSLVIASQQLMNAIRLTS